MLACCCARTHAPLPGVVRQAVSLAFVAELNLLHAKAKEEASFADKMKRKVKGKHKKKEDPTAPRAGAGLGLGDGVEAAVGAGVDAQE